MLIPEEWGKKHRKEKTKPNENKRALSPQNKKNLATKRRRREVTNCYPTISEHVENNDMSVYNTIDNVLLKEISAKQNCNEIETTNSTTNETMDIETSDIQEQLNSIEWNLELDSILSRIPYQQMLEDMFGGNMKQCSDVPIISRLYEESFMRECENSNERQCAMGSKCECMFIDPTQPFIATEFLLPMEEEKPESNMCVICSRKITQQLFHDMLFNGTSYNGVIQRFGNICGEKGEYSKQVMLICPENFGVQCLPLPIVAHQRNRYVVVIKNGTKHLKQQRVGFEDFQMPLTTMR